MKFSRKSFFHCAIDRDLLAQTGFSAEYPLAQAIKTVLDKQGKADLPLDRVVDASVVEEVLRERR